MIIKGSRLKNKQETIIRKIPFWLILLLGLLFLLSVDSIMNESDTPLKSLEKIVSFTPTNKGESADFQPDILRLSVDDQTKNLLQKQTRDAFKEGILIVKDEHWVKGAIKDNSEDLKTPIKLRLKGDWLDHLRGNKWSFRIKTKTDYAWNRLVTFSVQNPATRSYLDEWLFHQMLRDADILSPRYDFIKLHLNEKSLGVYAYEEHFDKQLPEYQKRREGPILKLTEDLVWLGHRRQVRELGDQIHLTGKEDAAYDAAEIRPFKEGRTQASESLSKNFQAAQTLLHQLKFKEKKPSELVDIERFARYLALADLLEAYHGIGWHNVRFYYNPITSKLEPIGYDGYGETPTPYHGGPIIGYKINFDRHPHDYFKYLFSDTDFFKKYIAYLDYYSNPTFLEKTMAAYLPSLQQRATFIQEEFKNYKYDSLKVIKRGKQIQALLRPYGEFDIKVRKQKDANGVINLAIANHHNLPVEIIGFGVNEKDIRDQLAKPIFIYSTPKFYASKFEQIPTNFDVKFVFYRVAGLTEVYHAAVVDWELPSKMTAAQQLFADQELESNAMYQVQGKQLIFKAGKHQIDTDLIIPAGYHLLFEPGFELDLIKDAAFISKSAVEMKGNIEAPIRIFSSDKTGNGFSVLEAKEKSSMHFVQFDNLNTLQKKDWNLTGAVNFYESNLDIFNCAFINSQCEDALNIIRAQFTLIDSKIANTFADGLDVDFGEGMISNLSIENTGNDGLDFSGSVINVKKIDIHGAGDKGISVGEEAHVNVTSMYINGANIAAASKDLSVLKINLINMLNCETGFAAYQKKPEFGPANIEVKRYGAEKIEQLYLLDKGSKLLLVDKELVGE